MPAVRKVAARPAGIRPPEVLRELISVAMDLERRTMQLYCEYESLFASPDEVRAFWFDMAEHESRHYGALAMVAGLLDCAPRSLPAAPRLTQAHVTRLRSLLSKAESEVGPGLTLSRAFETALTIESSEIEDLVLDLLTALKGESERERAMQILIHDLGDLSYMIEKYAASRALLARVDRVIQQQVKRLRLPERSRPARAGAAARR